ncbi:MAG: hypothetical protein LIO77_06580 [Rikenellaceae bacterium]|nr:hypothetical protein [Rikenellaceae bacterium]
MAIPVNQVPNLDGKIMNSPATAMLNGKGYLFFKYREGSNKSNYYYYILYDPYKKEWSEKVRCSDLLIVDNYSLSCVTYNGRIYFFWNVNKELYYTTFDGMHWDEPKSLRKILGDQGMQEGTNASSAVFNGLLYVFWNGSGRNGLWFATFNGWKWEGQTAHKGSYKVRDGSSPGVCASNDFMFSSWVGAEENGIWYSIGKPFVDWEKRVSLDETIGPMNVNNSSSPYTYFWEDEVYLFWTNNSSRYMFTKANRYTLDFDQQRLFADWIGEGSGVVPTLGSVPSVLMIDSGRYMIFYTSSNVLYYAEVEE